MSCLSMNEQDKIQVFNKPECNFCGRAMFALFKFRCQKCFPEYIGGAPDHGIRIQNCRVCNKENPQGRKKYCSDICRNKRVGLNRRDMLNNTK